MLNRYNDLRPLFCENQERTAGFFQLFDRSKQMAKRTHGTDYKEPMDSNEAND